MRILLVLIPISLVLLGIAITAFIWAARGGQFDDLDTPALDILADDEMPAIGRAAGSGQPSARAGGRAERGKDSVGG